MMQEYPLFKRLLDAGSLTDWFELAQNPLLNVQDFLRLDLEKENTNYREFIRPRIEFLILLRQLFDNQKVVLSDDDISKIATVISSQYVHPREMALKASLCEAVLNNIDRSEQPILWATFQAELASSLLQDIKDKSKRNAREAKAEQALRKSIEIFKQYQDVDKWALSIVHLGGYYMERESLDKDNDIEEAIKLFCESYESFKKNNITEHLPLTSFNLGNAFLLRKRGDRKENLWKALAYYTEALENSWEQNPNQLRGLCLLQLASTHAALSAEGFRKHLFLAVSNYRQVIDLGNTTVGDKIWALANYNLGTLRLNEKGKRKVQSIREAIELFENSIQATDVDLYPIEWANSVLAKAQALLDLDIASYSVRGEVIKLASEAINIFTLHGNLDKVASCHYLIGRAINHTVIDKTDDLNMQAIDHFKSALSYYEIENDFEKAASIKGIIADIECTLSSGNRSERIENSIKVLRENLSIFEEKENIEEFSNTLNFLGCCLINRIEGDRTTNVLEAISCFNRSLELCNQENDPDNWALINVNLGNAYRETITEDYAENIEKSIKHYQAALEVIDKSNNLTMWANARIGLAAAYADRFDENIVENFELALSQLIDVESEISIDNDPYTWANTQITIGSLLLDSPIGSEETNVQSAIGHFLKAGEVINNSKNSEKYADLLHKMGNAFSKVPSNSFAAEVAIDYYRKALEFYTEENYPEDHALLNMRLGAIYWRRLAGNRDNNREESIKYLENSLSFFTPEKYPYDWALLKLNLGSHYAERKLGDRLENLRTAKKSLEDALSKLKQEDFPDKRLSCLGSLTKANFLLNDTSKALELGMDFISGNEQKLSIGITDLDRINFMGEGAEIYEIVAFCLIEKNELKNAITVLDKGRARALSEWLYLLDIDITKLSDEERNVIYTHLVSLRQREMRLKQPDWYSGYANVANSELIRNSRENLLRYITVLKSRNPAITKTFLEIEQIVSQLEPFTCIVFPIITDLGSKVIIAWQGQDSNLNLDNIEIGGFSRSHIYKYLMGNGETTGLLRSYNSYKRSQSLEDQLNWLETIDNITNELWDKFISKLYQKLKELGIKEIIFVTQGIMQLLPIHSTWRMVDGKKCYLIDDFDIAYVPSLRSLAKSMEHISEKIDSRKRMLAVINPTGDLKYAEQEGTAISNLFDETVRVPRDNFVIPEILSKASSSSLLHFACHGSYNILDPWRSGLQVSDNEFLSLDTIMTKLNLNNIRLVTLSACESGIADFNHVPSEYIGLPSGFIYAGAPAVISSLWMVHDYATSLLMEQFYQNVTKKNMTPISALCNAQRWLKKDATNLKLRDAVAVRGNSVEQEYYIKMERKFKGKENEHPYAHPYYWAAFTITGM